MHALCVTVRDPFRPLEHRTVQPVGRRRRIRALAPKTDKPFIALLNGRAVLRRAWNRKLRDGDTLAFVVLPQGGGGGSNPMRMILMIAVAFAAITGRGALFWNPRHTFHQRKCAVVIQNILVLWHGHNIAIF